MLRQLMNTRKIVVVMSSSLSSFPEVVCVDGFSFSEEPPPRTLLVVVSSRPFVRTWRSFASMGFLSRKNLGFASGSRSRSSLIVVFIWKLSPLSSVVLSTDAVVRLAHKKCLYESCLQCRTVPATITRIGSSTGRSKGSSYG